MTHYIDSLIDQYFIHTHSKELLINSNISMTMIADKITEFAPLQISSVELLEKVQDFAFSQLKRLDPFWPSAGGIYRQDFRWHAIIPPISIDGPILCIRKHKFDLLNYDCFDPLQKFLPEIHHAMIENLPIIIGGITGSGKTSLLVSLLQKFCSNERVFIIEEISEIALISKRWVRLSSSSPTIEGESGFELAQLLSEVLRLSPQRIIISEIRNKEALAFSQAINCGHGSLFTTLHCHDSTTAISRLNQLIGYSFNRTALLIMMQEQKIKSSERIIF